MRSEKLTPVFASRLSPVLVRFLSFHFSEHSGLFESTHFVNLSSLGIAPSLWGKNVSILTIY